jgi:ubiquinone/menaquinone biosynthesis C-methylase UbiE
LAQNGSHSSPAGADGSDLQKRLVRHFDQEAATGDWSRLYDVADGLSYHFHVRRQRVMELLPSTLGRVADLGCGPGIMVPAILERGGSFVGIDVSPEMIREANAKYQAEPNVSFAVGDIENLDLPDEAFDQVICMGVIEYLEHPQKALAEIGRILRPGGTAVVSVSKRYHTDRLAAPLTAPVRWVARRMGFKGSGQVHRSGMQPRELDYAAALGRMVPEGASHYNFTPLPYPLTRIAPGLTMRVNLPFERWHTTENWLLGSLARGYLGRYRKMATPERRGPAAATADVGTVGVAESETSAP